MGKIRRVRQKYHLAATKSTPPTDAVAVQETELSIPEAPVTVSDDIFSGIDILFNNLKKTLKDSDTRSVISNKTTKSTFSGATISKKDKRKLRHELFLKKLEVAYCDRKKDGKKKNKQNKPKKDVKAQIDKLPALDLNLDMDLESVKKKDKQRQVKVRGIPKAKHRKKSLLQDIAALKNLLSDPEFKLDAVQAASSRVQEKVHKELENE
ncbi:hypothetical protein C0J52_18149 [Blattella germanica]|nr:hypothetical protein C0J52_18149 [Blattella germanica]